MDLTSPAEQHAPPSERHTSMFKPFPQQLLSPQFTFLVGDDKAPISVHAAVMASLSGPLDRLINGPMKEAQEKCAQLPDIELEVFLRLVEYAYCRDYTVTPCPNESIERQERDTRETSELQAQFDAACDNYHRGDLDDAATLTDTSLTCRWNLRIYLPQMGEPRRMASYPTPSHLDLLPLEHESQFMLHAQLYCFAEKDLINHLRALTLDKLHRTFEGCIHSKCFEKDKYVQAVTALIGYAYSNDNTPDREADRQIDLLRREVLEFAVLSMRHLQDAPCFEALLAENEQFAIDVVRLLQKLRHTGEDQCCMHETKNCW